MVFAGAGVSMGPPANYPDFKGLIRKIAKDSGISRASKDEPDDHYLGRLENGGIHVNELTKRFFADPKSKPNPLHSAIIRLHASNSMLRLVTTNFDKHFTTEIEKQLPVKIETYRAPALPVGNRFDGLVYIHGSVDGPADRLVLTDRDFGRAYLTEGWARRFLQEVYSNFTVLFIGYSHNDTVMTYLTRGLPPSSIQRFALTPEGANEHWQFLGITPVSYHLDKPPDRHRMLREAVTGWAELSAMGAFDHEQRVKKAVTTSPPIIGTEDDDYMQSIVNDEEKIHFFVRNASGKEWLLWAEERGLLMPLFSRRTEKGKRIWLLSEWFAREYVIKQPEIALGVFERQGQLMSLALWHEIARNFHAADAPGDTSLAKWLPILIDQSTSEDSVQLLEYLFAKVAKSGSWSLTLRLFEYLTSPRIRIEKSLSFFDGGRRDTAPTSSSIYILGSHNELKDALSKILMPHFPKLAGDLVRLASHNLRLAYDLGCTQGIANPDWEGVSFQRFAIEPHEQNRLNHPFDVVIDACRDGLEWFLAHRKSVASALIQEWILSPAPLLRRLAIHGMTKVGNKTPDFKLRWTIDHKLIASNAVHHELFQMLRQIYPLSNASTKKAFLDHAQAVTRARISENTKSDPDISHHALFRLLSWLDQAAQGKCPLARARLRRIRKLHPSFGMPDHADFTHWSSGVKFGAESPLTAAELRSKSLKDAISVLATFKGEKFYGPNRDGLLGVLSDATRSNLDWSLRLAKELIKRRMIIDDVWDRLFWSWSEAELTDLHWKEILALLDGNPELLEYEYAATQVVERGVRKEKCRLPYKYLPLAERIGGKLWSVAVRKNKSPKKDSKDWLQTAINTTGGGLTEFFMSVISLRRKFAEVGWTGIPKQNKKQLSRIVSGRSYTAEMGRILLASQMYFLFSCDSTWTRNNVIPLLSWQRSKRQAVQSWHGYLGWGKWSDDLLADLLPLYSQGFTRLNTDLQSVRERFVEHVAEICVLSTRKQTRGSWLNRFLRSSEKIDRKEFADSIRKLLWDLGPKEAARIWHNWLSGYWEKRIVGKPVPLDKEEVGKMVEWAPFLGPVFPDVVQMIYDTKIDASVDRFIYHMLDEKHIPDTHPQATAKLLLYLVKSSYEQVSDYGGLDKIIEKLVKHAETRDVLIKVLDCMALKGSLIAGKHKASLSGATKPPAQQR